MKGYGQGNDIENRATDATDPDTSDGTTFSWSARGSLTFLRVQW